MVTDIEILGYAVARDEKGRHIGPACPPGAGCTLCWRDAVCQCHGCGVSLCEGHWLHHSHTTDPLPVGWSGSLLPQNNNTVRCAPALPGGGVAEEQQPGLFQEVPLGT